MLEILVGLPGSGKSSYCKEQKEKYPDITIVSSDAIREEVFGDINDQSHNQEVFNIAFKKVKEAILNDKDVIFDATNLSRKRRINFIKRLPECNCNAVVFAVPFNICCERNLKRERIVPQRVMERMYKTFEPPCCVEGFNTISYMGVDYERREKLSELMCRNVECSHDNPNHSLSCGEHCLKAKMEMEKLIMLEEDTDKEILSCLIVAAECHDISKFKCKVFYDYRHEPSEIAHYYGHENVSSYDWLCVCAGMCDWKSLELVSNLISNHMVFFHNKNTIDKRRKLYGEEFWKYLELLHKADMAAH